MKRVDVTGEVCPRPALIVREELATLESSDTLLVEGDYPPAKENLERTCRNHGYDVRVLDEGGASFQLEISHGEDPQGSEA